MTAFAAPRNDAERPLVTFQVKAYRQEDMVRQAVESAFAQTYRPLEIILSDDASPDGTFRAMQEMAAAYDGPHEVRLNRNARNLGIAGHSSAIWGMARGQLFVSCAGDDVALPHKAERLAAAWRAGGDDVRAVHSKVIEMDAEGRDLRVASPKPETMTEEGRTPLSIARTGANSIGAATAWDRRLFDRFGPLPPDFLIEDGGMYFRAAISGRIVYLDEALTRYRIGGVSSADRVSPGYDEMLGYKLRYARWEASNARGFLRDMEKADFPEKEAVRAILERRAAEMGFKVELADASYAGKLARLPGAVLRSLRERDPYYAKLAVKYALGALYRRRIDRASPPWRWPEGHPRAKG